MNDLGLIHAASHRLIPPLLLFLGCGVALVVVSHGMSMSTSDVGKGFSGVAKFAKLPSLRAYIVPLIRVLSQSTDKLSVTIQISDTDALLADVRSGLVNTLFLGGSTWVAVGGPGQGTLNLISHVVPSSPVHVLPQDHVTWTTGWAQTPPGAAGALVIAFGDPSIGAL